MAFEPEELIDISKILGITPTLLDAQITALGATLTAAKETAILTEVTRWNTGIGTENVSLEPKESNKGVRTNPGADKADIRRNIQLLLEMEVSSVASIGIGTLQIGL